MAPLDPPVNRTRQIGGDSAPCLNPEQRRRRLDHFTPIPTEKSNSNIFVKPAHGPWVSGATLIEILTPFSGVGTLSKMLPFFGITLAQLGTQFRCFPGVTDPKTGAERVPDTKKRSHLGESGSQKAPRHLFDGA